VIILPEIKEPIIAQPIVNRVRRKYFAGFVLQNIASSTNKSTIFVPVTVHEEN